MSDNPTIVLHWYPTSPFAHKVAWALNFKKVQYKSVIISRIEPRPNRRPLDGGYRKTPILQIGNHTYCDTKAIFAELERRFPEPSFYPKGPHGEPTEASINVLTRWLDTTLFMNTTSQFRVETFDEAFLKDRSQFAGREINKDQVNALKPFTRHTMRADLALLNHLVTEQSQNGEKWAIGTSEPSAADLHIAMILWFINIIFGFDWTKDNFPVLGLQLKKTLDYVGYEQLDSLPKISEEEAIEVAKNEIWYLEDPKHDGSLPIELGTEVTVMPTDTGVVPSVGKLVHSTIRETVIEHKDETHGTTVYIHFPIVGFIVIPKSNKL
ncbi:hypothetical protein RMCBS344292_17330 [Rhizopus microsporus]|nr:hypothetical protein RMCBS344292_17330 [Rhizopus microsporus]